MRTFLTVLLAMLALASAACSQQSLLENLTDAQDRAMAESLLEAVRKDDVSLVRGPIHPEFAKALRADMANIRAFYPPRGEPKLINAAWQTLSLEGRDGTLKVLTYEVGADDRWSVADVKIFESGGTKQLVYIWLTPAPAQPSAAAGLSFASAGAAQYAFILAMAASIVTCLAGAVLAFRNRYLRYRWAWILGSLFAFVTFDLNWASGGFSVRPISFMLLGAAAAKPAVLAPWIVSFAIPFVAIVAIVKYFRRNRILAKTFETQEQP